MIQCGELDYAEDSLTLFGGLSSRNDSKTIPIEIALENLHKIKSELYSETKSNSDDILNIEVFGNLETKSTSISLPDTLLYIVNFTDNGFAILAGQTNLTSSVFCITEEGTLSTYNAWVIDGLYVRDVLDANTRNYIRTENLFHINWGWQGMSDGYYSQGVFDTSKRVATESGVDAGYMSSRNQYTWDYRTIVYDLN